MKKHAIVMPSKGIFYGYLMPFFTIFLFAILIAIAVFSFWYRSKEDIGQLMVQDIQQLSTIFNRIDTTCKIIGFDQQKNPINFLTIKKGGFVGSEVGSMNLAYPDKWEGPYASHNITMKGIAYQVVATDLGYFITPGEGVVLPNGKKIGTDIIFNKDTDIASLLAEHDGLQYQGKPLAAKIVESSSSPKFDALDIEDMAQAQHEWLMQENSGAHIARN